MLISLKNVTAIAAGDRSTAEGRKYVYGDNNVPSLLLVLPGVTHAISATAWPFQMQLNQSWL